MKSALLILALIAACTGCHLAVKATAAQSPAGRTIAEQKAAAVFIMVGCPDEPKRSDGTMARYMGTGVIVSRTQVLTAAHVVDCTNAVVAIQDASGKNYEAFIEMQNAEIDVARLAVLGELPAIPAAHIGAVEPGEQICLASAVPQKDFKCGLVEQVADAKVGTAKIYSTMHAEPGNSGSGVYDRAGHLVGILTHQRNSNEGNPIGSLSTSLHGREWVMP